ncbi:MAG: hypothetical protein PVJ49_18265 [Acidobacteriota bacterium]|jgi:hypothetical protein
MLGNSRKIGVWIDHRQATIVAIEEGGVTVDTVESHLEGKARAAGGARSGTPYGPQDVINEHALERRYEQQLKAYYAEVLENIGDATSVYAFGPARARYELLEVVEASPLHRNTAIETAPCDKLTGPQIVAHVKEHFAAPVPR